ncbi:unnamed protein product [Acanthoscelides obtectus]|uniref:Uncharacterized protein n=1 Tax=Acanthoscelides obtectus TaxID=200917 RepID=A0A9P0NW60_ACAOB|nr:unnamed protein product [Acanthoscelides obtectus]CAK1666023.1 hypothetical protein AOBTE_LOCUS25119 [Acanthoscelides obtectus]
MSLKQTSIIGPGYCLQVAKL